MNDIKLIGKVIVQFSIRVITGLRIGGVETGLKIGGVDQPLIRTRGDEPYIPGSSLKGKMRSLMEKIMGKVDDRGNVHRCKENLCPICKIWGIAADKLPENTKALTRLIVRDIPLKDAQDKDKCIEIKTETAINRKDSKATGLRTFDRVTPNTIFFPGEIVFNVFEDSDKELLKKVFEAMALLEDDYLGSSGSRGYGKIKFEDVKVYWNTNNNYQDGNIRKDAIYSKSSVSEILNTFNELRGKIT